MERLTIKDNNLYYDNYKVINIKIGIQTQSYQDYESGVILDEPYQTYYLYNLIKAGNCYIKCENDKNFTDMAINILPVYAEFMKFKEKV